MTASLVKYIFVVASLCSIANALTDVATFKKFIENRCYNKTHNNEKYLINGQTIPLSNGMETLIGLLERFEQNYSSSYSPSDVAEAFVTRFQSDNLQRIYDANSRKYTFKRRFDDDVIHEDMLNAIMFGPHKSKKVSFPEEAFTEDEKCALYYILSHAIVDCEMGENFPQMKPTDEHNTERCYTEQGVVTVHNHNVHAVAPGKVLVGILAGLKGLNEISIKDLISDPTADTQTLNEKINPIYAVTVGNVIVKEMLRAQTEENTRKFGPNGQWNSTICPTKYYLDPKYKPTRATYAELRGAGDGLLLGLIAQKLRLKNANVEVSSLLRMYYSLHGLLMPGEANRFSYCNRYNNWLSIEDRMKQQIKTYAKLVSFKDALLTKEDRELEDAVNSAFNAFETSRKDIAEIVRDNKRCLEINEPCEKQANVFVIMDNRGNENNVEDRQEAIISEISSYLDTRLYGGSITILSSTRGSSDRQLESVVFNTTEKGCVGCSMDWYMPQERSEDETYVFQSINKTLMHYEYAIATLPGVPGKVLIYFNYAEKPAINDRNFNNALWDVQNKHRDVPIFAIGKSDALLKKITNDDNKVFRSELGLVDSLNDKICKTFSTFQYHRCNEQKSSVDDYSIYEGFITPTYTQYWAMYPEYFLKSLKIKFYFQAERGDIKVCFSRSNRKDSLASRCLETSKAGKEKDGGIIFEEKNPCKGKNVYNCDPFYFLIQGKDHDGSTICKEKECKYLDQIKFSVKHEGISCNGSSSLVASLQAIVSIIVLLCVVRKDV